MTPVQPFAVGTMDKQESSRSNNPAPLTWKMEERTPLTNQVSSDIPESANYEGCLGGPRPPCLLLSVHGRTLSGQPRGGFAVPRGALTASVFPRGSSVGLGCLCSSTASGRTAPRTPRSSLPGISAMTLFGNGVCADGISDDEVILGSGWVLRPTAGVFLRERRVSDTDTRTE